jgi:uncharacterized protein YggE
VIDTALAKGANMITSLQFYASNTDAARREAIAIAVQKARADAEAAARAAGGNLGDLLEITIGSVYIPQPRYVEMKAVGAVAAAPATPIQAGDETVAVELNTRWRFTR